MAEEKPKREIDPERRAKMLANLEKGRRKRLENLEKRKLEMGKYEIKEKTETSGSNNKNPLNGEDKTENKLKNEKNVMLYPKKYECPCGKRYARPQGLRAHQNKCKYFQEKKDEEAQVYQEIEAIAREKVQARKKKTNIATKLEETAEVKPEPEKPQAKAEKEVKKEEAKVENVVIPNPVIPPPPALVRQNAEPVAPEPPKYTMKQWTELRQAEEAKKQHDAKQKREEAEKAKLQKAIASMRNGGLGFGF